MSEEKQSFDLEKFPTSESALRMLSYVTHGFYDKSYVGKWLYQVIGMEYDKAKELAEELQYQFFPETATWGLMYHEIKWGLPIRQNLSYDERRKLIYQKRDYRAPVTPYRMEKYLMDATGFRVQIADISDPGRYGYIASHPNVFKAYFTGEGTLDSKTARAMLDRLKQSHTTYKISDLVEVVIDNRDLEQIVLKTIVLLVSMSFWYDYLFDGTWLLDGNIMLDHVKRYALGVRVKLSSIDIFQDSSIEAFVETKTKGCWFFDGKFQLNGEKILNAEYRKETL